MMIGREDEMGKKEEQGNPSVQDSLGTIMKQLQDILKEQKSQATKISTLEGKTTGSPSGVTPGPKSGSGKSTSVGSSSSGGGSSKGAPTPSSGASSTITPVRDLAKEPGWSIVMPQFINPSECSD